MADDLKAMLVKVLQNKGKKRFFFAYGTGKRNDGNGDGHLVAAGKKPKKTEVQAACACSTFVEGRCWSSTDGATVYFSSVTKLAAPIVAKMALTAKKMVGKQFDFQIPSPEEETRAAALVDGEEGEQPQVTPGNQTDAPETTTEANGVTNAPTTDLGVKFTERLKGLVARVAKSGTKGAALNDMKLAISEAQVFGRKQDFDQANVVLDRLVGLLEASTSQPQTDPSAEWKAKYAEWSATIDLAIRFKGSSSEDAQRAAEIQKLKAQTIAAAKPGGDIVDALAKLTEAYELAKGHIGASFQKRLEAASKKVPEPSLGPDMDAVNEIRAMFEKAEAYGKQEKYGEGNSAIDDFEKLLKYYSDKVSAGASKGDPKARLKELLKRQKALFEKDPSQKSKLAPFSQKATSLVTAGKPGADEALDKLEEALDKAEGKIGDQETEEETEGSPEVEGKAGEETEQETEDEPDVEPLAPMARWESARAKVVARLQEEIKEVTSLEHPDVAKAELELRAVLKQINGKLENKQQVAEMERYLQQDDVVADVAKLAFDLKTPLLAVLAEITADMPA